MRTEILKLIYLFVFAVAFGEILDAAEYFPLKLGNTWRYAQYQVYNDTTVQSDTTIKEITILDEYSEEGERFFVFSGSFSQFNPQQWTVRLDTTTGEIFNNQTSCLWIHSELNIEDTLFTGCDSPVAHHVTSNDTVMFWGMFEEWRNYRQFTHHSLAQHTDYHLLDGIGPIRVEISDGFYTYTLVSDLIAAEIQGLGYGEFLGVKEPKGLPSTHAVLATSPNPFNTTTTIRFSMTQPKHARLKIFDIQGHEIRTLMDEYVRGGEYRIDWDASNVSSGVYIVQLILGVEVFSEKVLLVK